MHDRMSRPSISIQYNIMVPYNNTGPNNQLSIIYHIHLSLMAMTRQGKYPSPREGIAPLTMHPGNYLADLE